MKTILFTILLSLTLPKFLYAQQPAPQARHFQPNGSLKVSLSDQSLMVVSINGRKYDKVARELTIYDLPKGRNSIEIFRFIPNRKGSGGQAKLLHRGSFKVKPGHDYQLTYDIPNRRMFLDNLGVVQQHAHDPIDLSKYPQHNPGSDKGVDANRFGSLIKRMENTITDSGKLDLLKNELKAVHYISTNQLGELLAIFSFDGAKVEAIRAAYPQLSDPQNAYVLEDHLSFEQSKKEVREILNGD